MVRRGNHYGAGPFIAKQFALGDLGLGWTYSSLLFGCVIGAIVAGKLSDRFGCRRLLIIVALLFALSSVAVACAGNLTFFIAVRFLGGIAVGGVSLLSPLYVAEVAPPSVRGRIGTLYQLSIIIGIIVSYRINYLLRNAGANNWRWMFLTGVVPSLVFFLLIMLAPETPRFLAIVGRSEDAFRILERISGPEHASIEIAEIQATMLEEPSDAAPVRTHAAADSGFAAAVRIGAPATRNQSGRRRGVEAGVSEKSLRNGNILVLLSPQRPYWARSSLSPWSECEKDRQQRQPVV